MSIPTLNIGAELRSPTKTYKIKKVLGHGAFGITYLATTTVILPGELGEIESEVNVCIKEFFMSDFFGRCEDGTVTSTASSQLASQYGYKFKNEAINLSHLNHPNIVRVHEVFDANDTHYYVMQYIYGENLDSYVTKRGGVPEACAISYIKKIASALNYMHSQKMLHLDVKPKNIMHESTHEDVYLIDFGLSKQYDINDEPESSTTVGLGTPGYAPLEQSDSVGAEQFPATIDIYALGATFYKILTGINPPKAYEVMNDGIPKKSLIDKGVSKGTIALIEKMMQPLKKNRPQSISEVELLINQLNLSDDDATDTLPSKIIGIDSHKDESVVIRSGDDNEINEQTIIPNRIQDTGRKKKKSSIMAFVAFLSSLLLGIAVWWFLGEQTKIQQPNKEIASETSEVETKTFTVNGVDFKMVKVNAGSFSMGSTDEQGSETESDEEPIHMVTLSDYYIGQTEVTQALWVAVMGNNPSSFQGANNPVEQVSWHDCQIFIERINKLTQAKFRLPTEAEWEFAARGGNNSNHFKYSGSDNIEDVSCYFANSEMTQRVASKKPNELGIYDMSGNVWEWCQDWYGNYSVGSQTDPTGPKTGSGRVTRGGCWYFKATYCRVSSRYNNTEDCRTNYNGLRLALSQ